MECCKRVNLLSETAMMDRGDGVCRYLDEVSGNCLVYESRPDICRVDRQYEMHFQRKMTWDVFVQVNEAACRKLQSM